MAAGTAPRSSPSARTGVSAPRCDGAWRSAASSARSRSSFCDADGEYDPAELERLVAPILAGTADYVVGSRFAGGERRMRPHRELGNRVLTVAVRCA